MDLLWQINLVFPHNNNSRVRGRGTGALTRIILRGLWLVRTDHVTSILASDWLLTGVMMRPQVFRSLSFWWDLLTQPPPPDTVLSITVMSSQQHLTHLDFTANKLKSRYYDDSVTVTMRVCGRNRVQRGGWLPLKRKILEAVGIKNIFHSNLETDNEASNEILWSCKYQIGP